MNTHVYMYIWVIHAYCIKLSYLFNKYLWIITEYLLLLDCCIENSVKKIHTESPFSFSDNFKEHTKFKAPFQWTFLHYILPNSSSEEWSV